MCHHPLAIWHIDDAELADSAVLLLSELTTNAVNAAATPGREIGVRFELTVAALRLEVSDASDGQPRLRHAAGDDESGRGWRWWRPWPMRGAQNRVTRLARSYGRFCSCPKGARRDRDRSHAAGPGTVRDSTRLPVLRCPDAQRSGRVRTGVRARRRPSRRPWRHLVSDPACPHSALARRREGNGLTFPAMAGRRIVPSSLRRVIRRRIPWSAEQPYLA